MIRITPKNKGTAQWMNNVPQFLTCSTIELLNRVER